MGAELKESAGGVTGSGLGGGGDCSIGPAEGVGREIVLGEARVLFCVVEAELLGEQKFEEAKRVLIPGGAEESPSEMGEKVSGDA